MILKSKEYLIFQVAISIVTFIVMFLYQIIFPPSFVCPEEIFQTAALLSIYPTVIFSISSAIAWKLWNGKSWYSLSLILSSIVIAIDMLICFYMVYPIDSNFNFLIFLFSLDLLDLYSVTLIFFIVIIAGILGRFCLTMNNRISKNSL